MNHDFFWHSMSPSGGGRPMGSLQAAITASFHSFEGFQSVFTSTATQLFGSGYVWLVARVQDHQKLLSVTATANQDVPGSQWVPLLVLDVWEHAYYLKYQNKRADFIAGWWDIVNWDTVQRRLDAIPSV